MLSNHDVTYELSIR